MTKSERAALTAFESRLRESCDLLRKTAEQLFQGEDEAKGGIRRHHAANRIQRIADELAAEPMRRTA